MKERTQVRILLPRSTLDRYFWSQLTHFVLPRSTLLLVKYDGPQTSTAVSTGKQTHREVPAAKGRDDECTEYGREYGASLLLLLRASGLCCFSRSDGAAGFAGANVKVEVVLPSVRTEDRFMKSHGYGPRTYDTISFKFSLFAGRSYMVGAWCREKYYPCRRGEEMCVWQPPLMLLAVYTMICFRLCSALFWQKDGSGPRLPS